MLALGVQGEQPANEPESEAKGDRPQSTQAKSSWGNRRSKGTVHNSYIWRKTYICLNHGIREIRKSGIEYISK